MIVTIDITFLWDGIQITDPFMDETARFEVVPTEYYIAEEGEMVIIYLNGTEILLNYDGFNELIALLGEAC